MEKSGYYFIEAMPRPGVTGALPGNDAPEKWQPYKVWTGDLWRCWGCGAEILNGFGQAPISEHYKTDFADVVARLGADQLTVNDC